MDLLARREHSEQELRLKLAARGYLSEPVEKVLADLRSAGLQDDARYAEAYVRSRVAKGYGPLRITRELSERGLAEELVQQVVSAMGLDWEAHISAAREKKFGPQAPMDFKQQARQSRFLQYRGFTSEQIRRQFNNSE